MKHAPPTMPRPIIAEPPPLAILELIQAYMATWQETLDTVGLGELATSIGGMNEEAANRINAKVARLRREHQKHFNTMAVDLRPYVMWSKHRETYEPHPEMTRALVKMKSDTEIPGEIFRMLRHPNPLFLLPGAPPIQHADGHPGRMLAIFITGAVSKRFADEGEWDDEGAPPNASVISDTHASECNAYHAVVISEVHNLAGTEIIDVDFCHLTVPIRRAFTLNDLVFSTAAEGFAWGMGMKKSREELSGDAQFQYLEAASRAVVSHLLYACSRTVEMDDKPRASRPPAKRKKGEPKPPPSARIRRMGWRTGAAIADSIRRAATGQPGPGTGKKRAPHMRGAHMHLYRVGPGRREIDLKWLDPIPVNAGLDDGATITRHPMR